MARGKIEGTRITIECEDEELADVLWDMIPRLPDDYDAIQSLIDLADETTIRLAGTDADGEQLMALYRVTERLRECWHKASERRFARHLLRITGRTP